MSESLTLTPPAGPFYAEITPPGSKSLTNRAMVLAALGDGASELRNVLFADDTLVMMDCLGRLGFRLDVDRAAHVVRVHGRGGQVPAARADLFSGNSGTTIRFVTALCAAGRGRYNLDGIPRMRQRPIGELVDLLRHLGVRVGYVMERGFPPVEVLADGLPGGSSASAAAGRASSSRPSSRSRPTRATRCRSTSTARRRAGLTSR